MEKMRIPALVLAVLLLAPGLFGAEVQNHDKLARCLASKKVTMYGAFWCDHCKEQKELFGSSFRYIPYVECMIEGTRKINEVCKEMGIRRTPTWIFPDGDRREGVVPLDQLAAKSGCSEK